MTEAAHTLGVLQARLSSSRLPGKVLMPLGGVPMICFMIERLRRSRMIDLLVLATSHEEADDPLAEQVAAMGVPVVRGPLDDVLGRFELALQSYPAQVVVRLTGDCPLIDPIVVDRVIQCVTKRGADYASNTAPPTYPDGLDCEAFRSDMLLRANKEARLQSEREHVTPWIRAFVGERAANVECAADLSSLRWTVDYADDLALVRSMVNYLGQGATEADTFDFLRSFDAIGKPEALHSRNEGYGLSLAKDAGLD